MELCRYDANNSGICHLPTNSTHCMKTQQTQLCGYHELLRIGWEALGFDLFPFRVFFQFFLAMLFFLSNNFALTRLARPCIWFLYLDARMKCVSIHIVYVSHSQLLIAVVPTGLSILQTMRRNTHMKTQQKHKKTKTSKNFLSTHCCNERKSNFWPITTNLKYISRPTTSATRLA